MIPFTGSSNKYSPPSPPPRYGKSDPSGTGDMLFSGGLIAGGGGLVTFGLGLAAVAIGVVNPLIPIIGLIVYFCGAGLCAAGANWPKHAPSEYDLETYPAPTWLSQNVNIGFLGRTSSGKSSKINTMFGRRVAETGVGETTMRPTKYIYSGGKKTQVILWDCPGFGTKNFPASDPEKYILEMGLRYFSMVVLCISDAVHELDQIIIDHLKKNNIPYIISRTKIDESFKNERRDHGSTNEQTAFVLIEETKTKLGVSTDDIFLITNDPDEVDRCNIPGYGWSEYIKALSNKIKESYNFDISEST